MQMHAQPVARMRVGAGPVNWIVLLVSGYHMMMISHDLLKVVGLSERYARNSILRAPGSNRQIVH